MVHNRTEGVEKLPRGTPNETQFVYRVIPKSRVNKKSPDWFYNGHVSCPSTALSLFVSLFCVTSAGNLKINFPSLNLAFESELAACKHRPRVTVPGASQAAVAAQQAAESPTCLTLVKLYDATDEGVRGVVAS